MFALDDNAWPWLATILILIVIGIFLELTERHVDKGVVVAFCAATLALVSFVVVGLMLGV